MVQRLRVRHQSFAHVLCRCPHVPLPPAACPPAQTRLRKAIYDSIHAFIAQHGLTRPKDVIDSGCSVGLSTRWLAADFPDAQVGREGRGAPSLPPLVLAAPWARSRVADLGSGGRAACEAARPPLCRATRPGLAPQAALLVLAAGDGPGLVALLPGGGGAAGAAAGGRRRVSRGAAERGTDGRGWLCGQACTGQARRPTGGSTLQPGRAVGRHQLAGLAPPAPLLS